VSSGGITRRSQHAEEAIAANPAASDATKKPNVGEPSLCANLLSNDNGKFDFGDFQMLVFTVLAVGMYLAQLVQFTATSGGGGLPSRSR
jgi:hypothetical protein